MDKTVYKVAMNVAPNTTQGLNTGLALQNQEAIVGGGIK